MRLQPDFVLLKWQNRSEEYYVQVCFEGNKAELGLWLAPITPAVLKDVCRFIFKKYKCVETVEYRFGMIPCGKAYPTNHFRIELPDTADALMAQMTQKSRYNLRRSRRLLEERYGSIFFEEYVSSDVPKEIADTFFCLKKQSHGFVFDAPWDVYMQSHGITDIYVMKNGQTILAVLFSCEQCRIVYLENLTYDPDFSQYSPGQLLYQYYLERLIEKKRESLFLMGGNYEYKRRYGAIEDTVWFGILYKGLRAKWKNIYGKKLKKRYKRFRHSIKLWLTGERRKN